MSLRAEPISAVLVLVLFLVAMAGGSQANLLRAQSSPALPTSGATASNGAVATAPTASTTAGSPADLSGLSDQPAVPPLAFGGPPHPSLDSAISPDLFDSGHYWAGVYYTGSSTTASELRVTLKVPDDFPEGGHGTVGESGAVWYVALLSVFDNENSYDQIGFGTLYGEWQWAYSTSVGCGDFGYQTGVTTVYEPPARGQTYNFTMSLSSGVLDFSATIANTTTTVWNTYITTAASDFVISGEITSPCSTYDYTDYEEVMDTVGPFVPYDFFFTNNWANSFGTVGTWGVMSGGGAPSGVNVYIGSPGSTSSNGCPSGCPIMIANEPYYLYFTNGLDSTTVEPTASPELYYWSVTVADLSSDVPIYLSTLDVPSGWTVNLPGQGSPTFIAQFSFSLPSTTAAGSYHFEVNATDGSGSGSYDRVALGVDVLPILSASVAGSPGSGGIDVGQTVTFTANAGGGSSAYSYDWTTVPLGCTATTSASFQCAPASAGSQPIAVTVTDSRGYTTVGSSTYLVYTDPTVEVPSAARESVDSGQTVVFSVVASGGSGGYTYAWSGLPAGCTSSGSASDSCSPIGAGTFSIVVVVTDSNGFEVTSGALPFSVYSLPSVTLSVTPSSVLQAGSVTFTAVASGGAGGLVYSWNGLPSGCAATTDVTLTCLPSAAGTYNVTVTVTDLNGGQSSSSVGLTVNWAFLGLSALEWTGIIALVVLIGVILGIVLLAGRRRKRDDPENPSVAERIQQYSPTTRPSPVDNITVPPSEAWSDPSPGVVPLGAMSSVDPALLGTDTGGDPVYWHSPLLNPPETVCWHCQSENPPASLYCSKCGLPLEPPPPPTNQEVGSAGVQA